MRLIDGTGHRYTLKEGKTVIAGPFPGATALTALQDAVGGGDGLGNWIAAQTLNTVDRYIGTDFDWEQVRREAFQAKNAPRDLGSAVHVALDQFNRGRPLELTDKVAPYVAHYAAWLRNRGVEVVASERYTINTEVGYGGTYDALLRIDGETCLADFKTGKAKDSQRLQLTGLSMAEWHADRNQEAEPMPKIDRAYIVLVRPDSPPELIEHEITDRDRDHFKRLVEMYREAVEWRAAFAPTPIKEEIAA